MAEHVFIVGMMGSGKTTIGRLLAERLGWRHLDSDEQVGRDTGQTIPDAIAALVSLNIIAGELDH